MLSPEAIMKPSRIAPEPMISFSPFPQRSRVRMSRSVWFLVALFITLWGCVEAQFPGQCGYSQTVYSCVYAQQTTMPSSFLTSTKRVFLNNNQITSIPVDSVQGLTALTDLELSHNLITSIPVDSFQGLTALTYLSLFTNQITSIPVGAFQGLSALYNLYLYSNQITSIPLNAFQGLTALGWLLLYDNQITSIPVDSFQGLTALEDLRWTFSNGNNPLICSTADGYGWQRPFVCSSCRNGLNFYQNLQFYMCASTPPTTSPPTASPTPCDTTTNIWSEILCDAFTPSDCVNPETEGNCRLTCCSTTFPPTKSSSPTTLPTVLPSDTIGSLSNQSDSSDSSLYIIIMGVIVAINFILVIVVIRCRKAHKPTPSSTPLPPNNPVTTSNPVYATIERTYSEIGPNLSEYEKPMRHHPAYEARPAVYSKIDEHERNPQPYALLETSRKTYETTGVETSQYDVATMMTGSDSHAYNEVVEMSIRRDTGSFA